MTGGEEFNRDLKPGVPMLSGPFVVAFRESVVSKTTGGEEFDSELGSGVPMSAWPPVVAFRE